MNTPTEELEEAGKVISVNTDGTNYQGDGVAVTNPIWLFELRRGKSTWPKDLPPYWIEDPTQVEHIIRAFQDGLNSGK